MPNPNTPISDNQAYGLAQAKEGIPQGQSVPRGAIAPWQDYDSLDKLTAIFASLLGIPHQVRSYGLSPQSIQTQQQSTAPTLLQSMQAPTSQPSQQQNIPSLLMLLQLLSAMQSKRQDPTLP